MVVKKIEVESLLEEKSPHKKNGEEGCSFSKSRQPNQEKKDPKDIFTDFEHEEEKENSCQSEPER